MIIFSEIGDKTFLIAALMAMRHDRTVVFSAAFAALVFMTVLSALLGHAVPTLLPKRFTNFAAAILFLFFGVKLLREGLAMAPDEGVGEEMKEVEMELEEKELEMRRYKRRGSNALAPHLLESGRARRARSTSSALPAPARSPSTSPSPPPSPTMASPVMRVLSGLNNLCSLLLSPVWVQTFVMTFLGEWGDRSQIATVAMAAGPDFWSVTVGAVVGHSICTAIAVIGGRAIAGRVSMRIGKLCSLLSILSFANELNSHFRRRRCFSGFRNHLFGRVFLFEIDDFNMVFLGISHRLVGSVLCVMWCRCMIYWRSSRAWRHARNSVLDI
jgi:Ca2+/H+ antiporter, TMEM165/GDT1 family